MTACLLGASKATHDTLRAVSLGSPPPDFVFDTGSGPVRLSALSGKPVVINFWASWCLPCLDELEIFSRAQAEYGGRINIVTLSNERDGLARAYLLRHHLQRVPLAEDVTSRVFKSYTIEEIPVTLVLRGDGTVGYLSVGELEWDDLHGAIESALGGGSGEGT